MAEICVPGAAKLKDGDKKTISVNQTEILFIHHGGRLIATQPKCPHAGAPLEEGAICHGRLVCPWHTGTFELPSGELAEPPAMEGLKTYPVRKDRTGVFVELSGRPAADSRKVKTPAHRDNRAFVLVGGGAASAMAATTLRQEGFKGKIVVIDPVVDEPLDRTQLTKQALSGEVPVAKARLGSSWKLGVERIQRSILAISSKRRQVCLDNGKVLQFDAALVATGGIPQRLDIPGAEDALTIRHSEDVRKVLRVAKKGSRVVVIGTSFIGMEAASALLERGAKVTVVGEEELPFAKQFGERVAHSILALHKRRGVKFLLGATVISSAAKKVTAAKDGKKHSFPADCILMGVGIKPNLHFEHDLPMAEDGGIQVDESLRAAPRVWVAGDIATVSGTRIEHWRLAQQHGMRAGRQMLGSRRGFHGVPFFWTLQFGKEIKYLGHATDWDEIVYQGDVKKLKFLAFYVKGGRVLAVVSCDREQETAMLAEMMREHPTIRAVRALLRSRKR
ncbi:MAG TPA: FAD-dependent oxidoreductase [Terracidiphilus sp.]|jgi:NADPH-dependent 2,4-dienoyl-CoA reductase/sulfur reductase-like enzyme/nitrite reductase/ring-hydroxylating ferredoxin subunit|nr:FAD-dependent oxidoreductase [Terracidiphilus sp.]